YSHDQLRVSAALTRSARCPSCYTSRCRSLVIVRRIQNGCVAPCSPATRQRTGHSNARLVALRVWDTRLSGGLRARVTRRDAGVCTRRDRARATEAANPTCLALQRSRVGGYRRSADRCALDGFANRAILDSWCSRRYLWLCCYRQCLALQGRHFGWAM